MIQWSKGNEQVLKRLECREQEGKHREVSFRSQTNLAYPRSRLGTIGFGLCRLANESWSPDHGLPLVHIIGANSIERLIAKWKPAESFYFNDHGVRSCRSALALLVDWGHEAGADAGGTPTAGSLFCAEAAQRALSTVVARSAGRPVGRSRDRASESLGLRRCTVFVSWFPGRARLPFHPTNQPGAGEAPAGEPSCTAHTSLSRRPFARTTGSMVWRRQIGWSSLAYWVKAHSVFRLTLYLSSWKIHHALLLSFLSTFTYILICTIGWKPLWMNVFPCV